VKIFVVVERDRIDGYDNLVRAFRKKQDAETFVRDEPADYEIVEIELDS